MINSPIEINNQAFVLSKAFLFNRSQKNLPFLFSSKTVRKSKWWNAFVGVVEKFGNNPEWDANEFCDFCFKNYDIKYPHEMSKLTIWKNFVSRRENNQSLEKEITMDILNSFNTVKAWYIRKKIDFNNFTNFVEENPLWYTKISPYLISCSKYLMLQLTKIEDDGIINEVNKSAKFVRTLKVFNKLQELMPG